MTTPLEAIWLFLVFLRASLLSLGGSGALPLLRADLVPAGLLPDARIVEAIVIGRLSTGPGGLYVISIGYFVAGLPGALLAVLACVLPPLLILPIAGFITPRRSHRRIDGLLRGLTLSTSGLAVAVSLILLVPGAGQAFAPWQAALAAAAFVIGVEGRRHPILVIAAGGALGLVLGGG